MIKHVHIKNFKSLEDVAVDLDPVTVFIGRSGSGKSNFVDALRFLRDILTARSGDIVEERFGGWERVMSATSPRPMRVSFHVVFAAPGFREEFEYELNFQQPNAKSAPQFFEEKLVLGGRLLFHQQQSKWLHEPALVKPPQPGQVMLGALTGIQEATVAHLMLTGGIGCYAFPDQVLTGNSPGHPAEMGLTDNGDNFVQTVVNINLNLQTWHHVRDMAASLRQLKPTLKAIDLQQPQRKQIIVTHDFEGRALVLDVSQESEGIRRLLACLIAMYQTPSKQTLIFDEPEKGTYPVGLAILAEEFNRYASKGWGQVLLTTNSPELLDQFPPEQIRAVEMKGYTTRIGRVASEQMEALKERFLRPGELLTVDEARVETLAGV